MSSHTWRQHPKLKNKFDPERPDNLQVLLHDGDPRLTNRQPELLWVRMMSVKGDLFRGQVLDAPRQLMRVREGTLVRFIVPDGGKHPLQVRPRYMEERAHWQIEACEGCGLSELLEQPSVLVPHLRAQQVEEKLLEFEVRCGICGGIQEVRRALHSVDEPPSFDLPKSWWRFWKE